MATCRVDADALRRLASGLDETVAELGDAATVTALLSRYGYGEHAGAVAGTLEHVTAWCLAWTTSLVERADSVERHRAIFDRSTLIAADGMARAIAGLDHATLSAHPLSFREWLGRAAGRRSEAERLGAWLESDPDVGTVAATFAGAEPDVLAELVRSRPELVGSLPGAPLDVRLLANRLALTRHEAHLSEQIRTMRGESPRSASAVIAHVSELARLRADRALVRELNNADRHIVFFEPGDPLRVGEWIGPLDAAHVVVIAPGAGLVGNPFDRMVERAHTMLRVEPTGGNLAVVVAQVYAPPPNLGAAISGRFADVGGPELADFVGGLPLGDAHLTLVGHSYGSTVIGEAFHEGLGSHLAAGSDVVVLGSPGMRADTVTELGLDPAHAWVGLAPGDEIQAAVRPLALPGVMLCATVGGALTPAVCDPTEWLVHGRNPAHLEFGAQVFDTTASIAAAWLRHDEYFATHFEGGTELPSRALENLLFIASAQYDRVALTPKS